MVHVWPGTADNSLCNSASGTPRLPLSAPQGVRIHDFDLGYYPRGSTSVFDSVLWIADNDSVLQLQPPSVRRRKQLRHEKVKP